MNCNEEFVQKFEFFYAFKTRHVIMLLECAMTYKMGFLTQIIVILRRVVTK